MYKKFMPCLLAALIWTPYAWSAEPAADAAPVLALPEAIRSTLNQEYPGWILAPVTPLVQQEFKKHKLNRSPSLAAGDFDHDGRRDYAVQIALTTPGEEEQFITIFLARDTAYEETIVQSMGLDPSVYLWVAQNKVVNKDVLMVLGGPIGDTTYAYEDGKFHEVPTDRPPEEYP